MGPVEGLAALVVHETETRSFLGWEVGALGHEFADHGSQRVQYLEVRARTVARPFFSGDPGCEGSSACTWLFSSRHST